jgi:hypothetical protein
VIDNLYLVGCARLTYSTLLLTFCPIPWFVPIGHEGSSFSATSRDGASLRRASSGILGHEHLSVAKRLRSSQKHFGVRAWPRPGPLPVDSTFRNVGSGRASHRQTRLLPRLGRDACTANPTISSAFLRPFRHLLDSRPRTTNCRWQRSQGHPPYGTSSASARHNWSCEQGIDYCAFEST